MGLQASKGKLVYELVGHGNVEGIVALHRGGASLEWRGAIHGRTPLIRACRRDELWHVAKTLIDLGANVDAQEIRSPAGTALHSAAKRGLQRTVNLLLSGGANALLVDDNLMTPLDLARECGHVSVVRAIELINLVPLTRTVRVNHFQNHICLFSGWLLQMAAIPKQEKGNIWAVVLPSDHRNAAKIKLLTYSHLQVVQPCAVIELWKFKIMEPDFNDPEPALVIVHKSQRILFKFSPAGEGDKQQLIQLYYACRGMRQTAGIRHLAFPTNIATATSSSFPFDAAISAALASAPIFVPEDARPAVPTLAPSAPRFVPEDRDLDMAIDASIQSATGEEMPLSGVNASSRDGLSYAPIHHPQTDAGDRIDLKLPVGDVYKKRTDEGKHGVGSSLPCVICSDAPIEGACIPCGHMAGCMSCLNEIKTKQCGCPICRVDIERVIKLYAV